MIRASAARYPKKDIAINLFLYQLKKRSRVIFVS
jgi:hypothetical protein